VIIKVIMSKWCTRSLTPVYYANEHNSAIHIYNIYYIYNYIYIYIYFYLYIHIYNSINRGIIEMRG
jgi:hypothetical protein